MTFWGFPEDDWVLAKDLFVHDEGTARRSLAEEDVFGGGDNVSLEDNGELGIEEEPLETCVSVTGTSAGKEEVHSLDDACSFVAVGVDLRDDDAL